MHEFVAACEDNRRQTETVSKVGKSKLKDDDVKRLRANLDEQLAKERIWHGRA